MTEPNPHQDIHADGTRDTGPVTFYPALYGWTDYPILALGDTAGILAPVRPVRVLSYDGDKYAVILVEGRVVSVKRGYLYAARGRLGEVPVLEMRVPSEHAAIPDARP